MLVEAFAAGVFETNCYVVAPAPGESCIVVDPGQDAEDGLREVIARHKLTPVAVLLTHGHMDHMWSVTPVCDGDDIPAWIHPEDRFMLADPFKAVGPMGAQLAQMYPGLEFREPRSVEVLADGADLELAGLRLTVDHTPGHTRGSVVFRSADRGRPPVPHRRRHPVPGQHRAHRPARGIDRGDDGLAARQESSRCPTTPPCCPATGR